MYIFTAQLHFPPPPGAEVLHLNPFRSTTRAHIQSSCDYKYQFSTQSGFNVHLEVLARLKWSQIWHHPGTRGRTNLSALTFGLSSLSSAALCRQINAVR